jgi:peptide/nickel transport system permease protein
MAPTEAAASVAAAPRRAATGRASTHGRDRRLWLGVGTVAVLAVVGLLAPLLAPYEPTESVGNALEPPSSSHLFGTDSVGFDVFSRVLHAAGLDLRIAILATLLSLVVGVSLGILAGYSDGRVAGLASRASDTFQAFPVFIVALGLAAATGSKSSNLILIVAFLNAPIYFRLARSETRVLRRTPFVEAAIVGGETKLRVLARHILPNASSPLLAQASVTAGWALLLTAGLSFVGAGVRPPTAEWGAMIATGSENVLGGEWWPTVFPGLAILITVMAFGLISEAMTDRVRGARR